MNRMGSGKPLGRLAGTKTANKNEQIRKVQKSRIHLHSLEQGYADGGCIPVTVDAAERLLLLLLLQIPTFAPGVTFFGF